MVFVYGIGTAVFDGGFFLFVRLDFRNDRGRDKEINYREKENTPTCFFFFA